MASEPAHENRVVAVFNTREDADAAARAAREAGAQEIRVGDERDAAVSMTGEMREEVEHTFVGPGNIGPFTKEMAKGHRVGIPLGTAIGTVIALPLAFLPIGTAGIVVKLILAAIVGAIAGFTVAFVAAGGFAKPPAPMAAERGVTVSVLASDDARATEVADVLSRHAPIRVDRLTPSGQPRTTVTTEEERGEAPETPPDPAR